MYSYVPSFLGFLPIQVTTGQYSRFSLFILYIESIGTCVTLNLPAPPTLPFPLGIHTFVLSVCVSISALQTRASVTFF